MSEISANTTRIASELASDTASKASELASMAMRTASELAIKTAETNAIISTNIDWVKKSLVNIELKLNEMDKAFVTSAQHDAVLKELANHETRVNGLETEKTRTTVLLSVGSFLLSIVVSLIVYLILHG